MSYIEVSTAGTTLRTCNESTAGIFKYRAGRAVKLQVHLCDVHDHTQLAEAIDHRSELG